MPIIKSAQKKLRKDIKREKHNKTIKSLFKNAFKKALKKPSEEAFKTLQKVTDKAAKSGIIHKNKASRIKSKFAKLSLAKSK